MSGQVPVRAAKPSSQTVPIMLPEIVSAYISDALTLVRLAFPDLSFGRLNGKSVLVFSDLDISARYIRIEKECKGVMHLKTIVVRGGEEKKSRDLLKGAQLTYSSVYPGAETLTKQGLFTTHHKAAYAFHTQNDDPAWVQLDLQKAEKITQIEIYNRSDRYAERGWDLAVLVSSNGDVWQNIHSQAQCAKQVHDVFARKRTRSLSELSSRVRECIDDVLMYLMIGNNQRAVGRLQEQAGLSSTNKKLIQKVINEKILLERGVEWTNHGIKRTFRFWSTEEKRSYMEFASETICTLQHIGLDAVVGYGGVLSMVRDFDLIPHDDDLDVLVIAPRERYPKVGDFIKDVEAKLLASGYKTSGDYLTHRHCSKGGKAIDIFFGFQEGEFVSSFPGPRRVLRREDLFPPLMCQFLGVSCPMPHNPFQYAQVVYGEHWRTPLPGWNHSWDRTEYEDWLR